MWHWLAHHLGTDNGSGGYYLSWSGWGSDIGEAAILGGLVHIYRKHVCHVDGCMRLARHPVVGTPYVVCRLHHPEVPGKITAAHVADAHEAASK